MTTLKEAIAKMQPLTIGETIQLANDYDARVVDVVLEEAINQTGLPREEILTRVMDEYAHNLKALDIGLEDGESVLMGTAAADLNKMERPLVFDDVFLDNALLYTQAAQVGNHCIGLR
ncbi:MAG TPA: serine dehydratase, partial [Oscillospiraceae bacterium]|nr:serine dehydratase [Oscillospiraceae bacterium]